MNSNPSYINAAAISGLIFGLIISIISIVMGYMEINSEPSGATFSASAMSGFLVCIIGAFAGLLTLKLYVKEHDIPVKLGQGAVIGLVTGLIVAVVGTIISLVWHFVIDPSFTDRLMEASIANIELMTQLPGDMKDDMIDGMYTQFQNMYTTGGILKSLGMSALFSGFMNMLTGILGAKLFAEQPVESLED